MPSDQVLAGSNTWHMKSKQLFGGFELRTNNFLVRHSDYSTTMTHIHERLQMIKCYMMLYYNNYNTYTKTWYIQL